MVTVYTKYITLKNGKVIHASEYGKEAFCFEVSEEEYEEHQKKQKQDN